MSEQKPRRKLAAILAADVVGFSKKMGENEDRTLRNLKACRTLTDESIEAHHGRVFGSAGDSVSRVRQSSGCDRSCGRVPTQFTRSELKNYS